MLEELFNDIEYKLKTDCPFVKHIQMYQQQDLFEEQNKGYAKTAVFISYQNLIYSDYSAYTQICELEVSVKVVVEEKTKNYFKALKQKNAIVYSLQYFNNLTRISETLDTNPSGIYVYEIVFSTAFTETLEPVYIPIGGTSGYAWSYDTTLSIDSNNDGIFSGWASTSGIL